MNRDARKLQKRKQREERIRLEKHRQRFVPLGSPAAEPEPEIHMPPNHALAMERTSRRLQRIVSRSGLHAPEDINRLLAEQALDPDAAGPDDEDPIEQAQQLAYRAMETSDPAEALELCEIALDLDPDCVDALVTVGALRSRTPGMMIRALEEAVAAGERSLGKDFFEEHRGHFWGLVETRPYMRARHDLALLLLKLGREDEAIGHMEGLLELNPNDNQGVRDVLLGGYLEAGNVAGASRLLQQYDGDPSAVFRWGRVLAHFLAGELDEAESARASASEANPFVEPILSGRRRPPAQLPDYYSPGEPSEAADCAHSLNRAWTAHAGARAWLRAASEP